MFFFYTFYYMINTEASYWPIIYFIVYATISILATATEVTPLDVHITSLQRPLSASRETKLICQSHGSGAAILLTWWLGSRQLMNTKNIPFNDISVCTLTYIPAISDHQKVLSCRAVNAVLNGTISEDHWVLNVYYVPQLVVTVGAIHPNIKEGDDVYFDCNIQANPIVTEVGWRFNGKAVYTHLASGIKVNNQSLLLRQVTREKTGNYSCVAANVEGESSSQEVCLDVHYLPYCQQNQKMLFGVPLKQSIDVICSVEANPSNVVFDWYMNTTIKQIPWKRFITNGTQSLVKYTPKQKKDYGYLFCRAHNSVGLQLEPCSFKISPANVPSTVQNCAVDNETLSSIEVTCEPGFDGGMPQKFHLELYSTKGFHVSLLDMTEPIFEILDLPSGISYIAVIFSSNKFGRSNSVALTAQTLPPPANQEDIRFAIVTPALCVLIVIIGSLVLMAIIIVIGVRHQDSNISSERTPETPCNPVQPYDLRTTSVFGELKAGQYI